MVHYKYCMKLLAVIFILGAYLNIALAQEPEITEVSQQEEEESSEPKFSNLVKTTMDLLGPVDEENEEVSLSQDVKIHNLTQTE